MTEFEVNLIKGKVPSASKRKAMYLGIFVYLALCGALLIAVTNGAAHRWVEASANRHDMRVIDREFMDKQEVAGSMRAYAGQLKKDLGECNGRLEALEGIVAHRAPAGRILLGLVRPLPRGVDIIHFDMGTESDALVFDLVIPIEQAKGLNARQLIESWQTDVELMSQVKGLKSLLSQRQRIGGGEVYVHRFTCSVERGEDA